MRYRMPQDKEKNHEHRGSPRKIRTAFGGETRKSHSCPRISVEHAQQRRFDTKVKKLRICTLYAHLWYKSEKPFTTSYEDLGDSILHTFLMVSLETFDGPGV